MITLCCILNFNYVIDLLLIILGFLLGKKLQFYSVTGTVGSGKTKL